MYTQFFKPFPTIETDRLILRKIKKSDAKDLYEYCSSEVSARYSLWEPHEDLGVTRQYISWLLRSEKRGEYFTWGIELKSSGKLIGTVSLPSIDKDYKVAEIGYGIIDSYWGNGYASEAIKAIMEYGFCTVGFICINAKIMKENSASVRVASAVGMQCDGLLRNGVYCKGKAHDVYVFSMIDTDYKEMLEKQENETSVEVGDNEINLQNDEELLVEENENLPEDPEVETE